VSYLAQISGRTKAQTPKNRNPTRVLRRRSEACRAKGNTPWRRSPNFAKWRTTSTRGRKHRIIRLQSESSGSRPTTILKRPSTCGAAKISKSGFSKKIKESTTESTIYRTDAAGVGNGAAILRRCHHSHLQNRVCCWWRRCEHSTNIIATSRRGESISATDSRVCLFHCTPDAGF
jgi:hypothetical protein